MDRSIVTVDSNNWTVMPKTCTDKDVLPISKAFESKLTRREHEVVNFTRSRVRTKSKLTNLVKLIRIEGYNGK